VDKKNRVLLKNPVFRMKADQEAGFLKAPGFQFSLGAQEAHDGRAVSIVKDKLITYQFKPHRCL
jgi:hypothetical protein